MFEQLFPLNEMSENADGEMVELVREKLRKMLDTRLKCGYAFSQLEDAAVSKAWVTVSKKTVFRYDIKDVPLRGVYKLYFKK